jgi:hypothetical protein
VSYDQKQIDSVNTDPSTTQEQMDKYEKIISELEIEEFAGEMPTEAIDLSEVETI